MSLFTPKLTPSDYYRVQCYRLHLNFTFLTCHVVHTLATLCMYITQLISVLASLYYLLQTQSSCTNLTQYFTKWKIRLNAKTVLFSNGHPRLPDPIQTDNTLVPKASHKLYLSLCLYSVNLSTQSTSVLHRFFPLLTRDSTFSQKIKLTLYKLLIQSILIYTTPVWGSTCDSSYLKHKIVQNKSL